MTIIKLIWNVWVPPNSLSTTRD